MEGQLCGGSGHWVEWFDPPAAFVDFAVVVAAEQAAVGQVGGSVVEPGGDVVGVGVCRWAGAVREPAAPVAQCYGPLLMRGEKAMDSEFNPIRVMSASQAMRRTAVEVMSPPLGALPRRGGS